MNKRAWILYGGYAVVVALFFLYYLFPSQSLKTYIIAQVERVNPEYRLEAGRAELVFPYRIRLHDVKLDHFSDRILEAEELTVVPRLSSLISRKTVLRFSMNSHQGLVDGTADIADGQRLVLNAVASGVQLSDIPFLQRMSTNQLEGVLNGMLYYAAGNGRLESLNLNLEIIDMTVTLAVPFFSLDRIGFDSVEAEAALQNQQLKISRVTLTGNQIEGNLSGYATIENDVRLTVVELNGTVMPKQELVEGSGFQIPPAILDNFKSSGGIPVRISGPIGDLQLETR